MLLSVYASQYRSLTFRQSLSACSRFSMARRCDSRAASFGYKSLSKYLIERGLTDGVMIQSADREKIERLLFEVRKFGVNLNLIAAQMSRGYSEHSRAQLDRTMQQVERILGEVAGEIVR